MEYTLNMVFLTAGSKKVTFSVSAIKENLSHAETNALMDAILAQNIFTTSSGDLAKKDSAQIVAKTVTKINIA